MSKQNEGKEYIILIEDFLSHKPVTDKDIQTAIKQLERQGGDNMNVSVGTIDANTAYNQLVITKKDLQNCLIEVEHGVDISKLCLSTKDTVQVSFDKSFDNNQVNLNSFEENSYKGLKR